VRALHRDLRVGERALFLRQRTLALDLRALHAVELAARFLARPWPQASPNARMAASV
jgi:hypothetical protein